MKKTIQTEIHINASPQEVWTILTETSKFPEWNPFVTSLTGKLQEGEKIKIILPDMTFKPKVLTFSPHKELKWLGYVLFKGLMDGEHQFLLQEQADGTTLFKHNETFSGLLVGVMSRSMFEKTKNGFHEMNEALKSRVEMMESVVV